MVEYTQFLSDHEKAHLAHLNYLNQLSTETIHSVVFITKAVYLNVSKMVESGGGTGVIIHADSEFYYVLTNHHIIHINSAYQFTRVVYEVFDYQNGRTTATLIHSDPTYDLAVLRIPRNAKTLKVVQIASTNPEAGTPATIIGFPLSQKNAITMGRVMSYGKIDIINPKDADNKIDFESLISNIPVQPGSSGSPVFDFNHRLIGLVYAGNFRDDKSFSQTTYAIPIEKIIEYTWGINLMIGAGSS